MSGQVKPFRGPRNRSLQFEAYLDRQSPERVHEIVAAERAYDRTQNVTKVAEDPAQRDYLESFIGYEDPPAGIKDDISSVRREGLLSLVPGYKRMATALE